MIWSYSFQGGLGETARIASKQCNAQSRCDRSTGLSERHNRCGNIAVERDDVDGACTARSPTPDRAGTAT
jgi:hypothetical protein